MNSMHVSDVLAKNPTGGSSVSNESERSVELGIAPGAQLALRSDGALMMSVEHVPAHIRFEHRERCTFVVLTASERALVEARIANAEAEVAAHLAMNLSKAGGA